MSTFTISDQISLGSVGLLLNKPGIISDKIQFRFLINVSLAIKYSLRPYITAEGGIEGTHVRLINDQRYILGLQKDPEIIRPLTLEEHLVLIRYKDILRVLFIEGSLGLVIPPLLWIEKKYNQRYKERFTLLLRAIISSEFKNRENFSVDELTDYISKFYKKIRYYLQDHLYGDEFVPINERGVLKNIYSY